jgi:hypothetical protein
MMVADVEVEFEGAWVIVTVGAGTNTVHVAVTVSLPPGPVTSTSKVWAPALSPVRSASVDEHVTGEPSRVHTVEVTDPVSL